MLAVEVAAQKVGLSAEKEATAAAHAAFDAGRAAGLSIEELQTAQKRASK